jgi:DNA-binding beta-propeller fold protein YncE
MFGKYLYNLLGLCLLFACLTACNDESKTPIPTDPSQPTGLYQNGVFVVCEGNFGWGIATLSFIEANSQRVSNRIFSHANSGQLLGNVAQSMVLYQNKGYIVVNNSRRIEVIEPQTAKSLATFEGFTSPRYLLPIGNDKAYLSTIYETFIYLIDLNTGRIEDTIELGFWSEKMFRLDAQNVMVVSHDSQELVVLNPQTHQIRTVLRVGRGAKSVVVQENGTAWVLTAGAAAGQSGAAQLFRIEAPWQAVELVQTFSAQNRIRQLALSNDQKTLFYVQDQDLIAYEIATQRTSVLVEKLPASLVYNLAHDPKNPHIYLADALDYVQEGIVWQYHSRTGQLLGQYSVGVIPNDFCFIEP